MRHLHDPGDEGAHLGVDARIVFASAAVAEAYLLDGKTIRFCYIGTITSTSSIVLTTPISVCRPVHGSRRKSGPPESPCTKSNNVSLEVCVLVMATPDTYLTRVSILLAGAQHNVGLIVLAIGSEASLVGHDGNVDRTQKLRRRLVLAAAAPPGHGGQLADTVVETLVRQTDCIRPSGNRRRPTQPDERNVVARAVPNVARVDVHLAHLGHVAHWPLVEVGLEIIARTIVPGQFVGAADDANLLYGRARYVSCLAAATAGGHHPIETVGGGHNPLRVDQCAATEVSIEWRKVGIGHPKPL